MITTPIASEQYSKSVCANRLGGGGGGEGLFPFIITLDKISEWAGSLLPNANREIVAIQKKNQLICGSYGTLILVKPKC